MKNNQGFGAVAAIIIIGLIILGGGAYVMMNPQMTQAPTQSEMEDDGVQTAPGDHNEVDNDANEGSIVTDGKVTVAWRFAEAAEVDGVPQTEVTVVINGKAYSAGKFEGSCSEIGASGGMDGKGLLAGELSAVQCWFAGGGNEIGVFAHEDGGVDIMVGELSEGEDGGPMFRGDFSVKNSIAF